MKRRDFVKGSAVAAAGLALGSRFSPAGEGRPNVLVILVDQMRRPRWTPDLRMPNLDRLARSGVSFTSSFVSAAPCSPSRACLMTGLYTTQNGMYSNCDFVEGNLQPSLDPAIPTIGRIFRDAGYRTPYRGKWHLTRRADRDRDDCLIDYGFEGWKPPEAYFGGPPYCGKLFDPMYAKRASEWLSDPGNHNEPWLMVSSLVNPHDICAYPRYYPQVKMKEIRTAEPPPNWTDDLSSKPGAQREHQEHYNAVGGPMDLADPDAWRRYLDYYIYCLEDVDANIGTVLDALEASGQRDNTIIVFTSDHGEMGGSHRLRTKGCFAYEEVLNVPLIFSWPGRIPAGVSTDAMASNVDVMPTLASLAGLSGLPYMSGVDQRPALEDPAGGSAREDMVYHSDWEVKLAFKSANDTSVYKNPAHVRTLRERDWKYSFYFAPDKDQVEHELYNLKDDPLEMTNLADDAGHASRRKAMHERLMAEEDRLDAEWQQR